MPQKKLYTLNQALEYAKGYCAKEEHCQSEVATKLRQYGVCAEAIEECLAELIVEGYINEQRYADLYAQSKFHQNGWGRVKIALQLRAKEISKPCIDKAVSSIDLEEYLAFLKRLCQKKLQTLKSTKPLEQKRKTTAFLLSRGFEYESIKQVLDFTDEDF